MRNKIVLTVIYVYYNTPDEILHSINTLKRAIKDSRFEVIIVDNHSHIPLPRHVRHLPYVKVLRNKRNRGYGAALNQGALQARGEYILCSNTDTLYNSHSLSRLIKFISSNKKIGVVGPKMVDEFGRKLQTASRYPYFPFTILLYTIFRKMPFLSLLTRSFHYNETLSHKRSVEAIGGACMLFRRNVFEKVQGFDEKFFLYFEEADICKRINEQGYKCLYFPQSTVTHFVGRSLKEKLTIQRYFERSRFLFVKKHQNILFAYLSESMIRFLSGTTLLLLGIFLLSLFLNTYKLSEYMMFFGDFARDMLVARNSVLYGTIPLLGIPSSVVWLHQGPLSIYMIALSFVVGGFAPWVPSFFYAVLGSVTSILVYKLGRSMFNKHVGLMGAFLFATSPLVIVNSRMPYHTAPIPLFATMFFLSTLRYLKTRSKKMICIIGLLFGFLFQLELSNAILFLVLLLVVVIYKVRLVIKDILIFVLGFGIGISPFIIYDLSHGFLQTGGFVLWVINRVRLFLGLTFSGNSTTSQVPEAITIIWEQIVRFVFPASSFLTLVILIAGGILLSRYIWRIVKNKHSSCVLLILGIVIPLVGFVIHARPGIAYFPVLFPVASIALALMFYILSKRIRSIILLFFLLGIANATFVVQHSYFLDTNSQKGEDIQDWNYGLGPSLKEQRNVIEFIKNDAEEEMALLPGGFLKDYQTSIDNYIYLAKWENIPLDPNGKHYTIYQDLSEIPSNETTVYTSSNIAVTKDE